MAEIVAKASGAGRMRDPATHASIMDCAAVGVARHICNVIGLPGRVAVGALFAIVFGFLCKESGATDVTWIKALKLPGALWLRLLKMVVVPLVFSNIVTAVTSIKHMSGGSKLGWCVVFYYTVTTLLAAAEGLVVSAVILIPNVSPIDESLLPAATGDAYMRKGSSLSGKRDVWDQFQAILEGFTPTNVVGSAASGDLLGVISFSIIFALALPAPKQGQRSVCLELLEEINSAMFRIIESLIVFTPVGVFSLVCEKVILLDIQEIVGYIGIFLATVFAGLAVHNFCTYPAIYFALTRRNPFTYMRGIVPAMFTALGTSSSASTLPVTIQCAVENNKVSVDLAKFVLSLGATVNMDGTAIGFPVAVLFLAYAQGITFTVGQAVTAALVSTLSAMGAAPIPSAGLVLLVTILESVDVPVNTLFGLIIAVDWIYDRPETMTNIVGDSFAAGIMEFYFGGRGVPAVQEEKADLESQHEKAAKMHEERGGVSVLPETDFLPSQGASSLRPPLPYEPAAKLQSRCGLGCCLGHLF